MKRILALDVGSVRVGVAMSDPLGITAQPLEVIERKKNSPFQRVKELVEEHEVTCVLIGRPLTMSGEAGLAVQAIEAFAEDLRKKVSVPLVMWDERLTTKEAERMMIQSGARRETRKANIDKIAAAILLQSYLDAGCP